MSLGAGRDMWRWNYDSSGFFSVSGLKCILVSANRELPNRVFEWNNWVPKKVAIVAWRSEMERLPTKCALSARNIPVQNQRCSLCSEYDETCEHLFVACHSVQSIWQNITLWCKIPPIIAFDVKDLLDLHSLGSASRKKRKAIHAIVLVTFWGIWKSRNEVIFRQGSPSIVKVLEEIKAMAFLWVKNRSKEAQLTWEDWCRFSCFG
ncbi:putative reverse transcriptase zinc-binding domain-containing protein [Helianthus annuus]|nr:putative reverse transcriptase zinc-binding domain-containing protein [Helianthus annuus]KAJ0835258.1 putative reverse transcriptase zinc-binding domain-containing protein [Helianthus annuus]